MNVREIVTSLRGTWSGTNGMCSCPLPSHGKGKGDRNASLKVWESDDGIRVHCFSGCDWRDVRDELRRRDLVQDDRQHRHQHHQFGGDERHQRRDRQRDPNPKEQKRIEAARRIWRDSKLAPETLVETYLKSRGITASPPPSLRYHPALRHKPTASLLPAMVGGIQGPHGTITGVHRIFLDHRGRKATCFQNKMMLGRCSGGAVRLSKAGPKLAVAEGIETALSVQQATGIPTWAALSTSGLTALVLPQEVREVVIFADADKAGEKAALAAAKRFSTEGRTVRIARPPEGASDFNDVLMKEASGD